jgi:hypothetical protein
VLAQYRLIHQPTITSQPIVLKIKNKINTHMSAQKHKNGTLPAKSEIEPHQWRCGSHSIDFGRKV